MILPRVHPMLCKLVDKPFDDDTWIFEDKLDGLRVICRFDGKNIELLSRNDLPQNLAFPEIAGALRKSLKKPAIVDGEIVCFDAHGHPSFRELQQRFHITDRATVERRQIAHPAYIYLFDILFYDRKDLRDRPLVERKKLLRAAIKRWSSPIFWTEATRGAGIQLLEETCKRRGEGIVAKRLESHYTESRSGAWLKIKCSGRQEFVIGGFTEPRGSRSGFGALLVGYFDAAGKKFSYAGKVGTGFNDALLRDLHAQLKKIETSKSPFATHAKLPRGSDLHWVKPKLVAEIGFAEWTTHGLLRQPRFEGLRDDKNAKRVRREDPE